jgi:hypothetical protein
MIPSRMVGLVGDAIAFLANMEDPGAQGLAAGLEEELEAAADRMSVLRIQRGDVVFVSGAVPVGRARDYADQLRAAFEATGYAVPVIVAPEDVQVTVLRPFDDVPDPPNLTMLDNDHE